MIHFTHTDTFQVTMTETPLSDGIRRLHFTADCQSGSAPLQIRAEWLFPCVDVHAIWSPAHYGIKKLWPSWGGSSDSCATIGAPILSNLDSHDINRQTIACSDALNSVSIHTGVVEENGFIQSRVTIRVECAVSHYEADIRIDTRPIPFYEAVEDVVRWWETLPDYQPALVPACAHEPLYSTWYSYHQNIDVPAIVEDCRRFAEAGCRVLIVDDGWQTDDSSRGYNYCGDWQPTTTKVPDMKKFVDAVHETGMKFVLWYSVPFIGEYTAAFERFRDKTLRFVSRIADSHTYVLDPRYPEVREYLISLYKNAVLDWGLDGFKLDFVDSFSQSDVVREGMDYTSVYDAVDRLLKDVIRILRELKPDILIEFRQSYIGPLMRTFGNMFRAGDCPCDSMQNRLSTLTLRQTSGSTAVHSDMVMWHYDESPEQAAFQLTNVLFAVPQVSTRWNLMSQGQRKMVSAYLKLWNTYRDTLLFGKMLYKGYMSNYPYVSARSGQTQVGAVYSGRIAYIEVPTEEIVLVNATLDTQILLDCAETGLTYDYTVFDCTGVQISAGSLTTGGFTVLQDIPVNGTVILNRR